MRSTVRSRVRRPRRALFVLLALFAGGAGAHETVDPNWCVGESQAPLIVSEFNFDKKALTSLVQRCGEVDKDHWHQANAAIQYHCAVEAEQRFGKPVPFISGPREFLDKRHHDTYRLDLGLTGVCAVCVQKVR
jgi:hypothetical protein